MWANEPYQSGLKVSTTISAVQASGISLFYKLSFLVKKFQMDTKQVFH